MDAPVTVMKVAKCVWETASRGMYVISVRSVKMGLRKFGGRRRKVGKEKSEGFGGRSMEVGRIFLVLKVRARIARRWSHAGLRLNSLSEIGQILVGADISVRK